MSIIGQFFQVPSKYLLKPDYSLLFHGEIISYFYPGAVRAI